MRDTGDDHERPCFTWDEMREAVESARASEAVRIARAVGGAGDPGLARMILATSDPRLVHALNDQDADVAVPFYLPFVPTQAPNGDWVRLGSYELGNVRHCAEGPVLPAGNPTYPNGRDDGACPFCGDGAWGAERFEGETMPGSFGADFSLLRKTHLDWVFCFRQTGVGCWGGNVEAAFCPVCGKRLQGPCGPMPAPDAPCPHCRWGEPYVSDWSVRYEIVTRDWLGPRFVVDNQALGRGAVPLRYCPTCGELLEHDEGDK
ncbi:hypothetical protein QJ043_07090 [Olsenella sp. YH-ols2217]|uniref:Uncharacterized protein n=1 Tax=Kribbibacterium absianum TaxID=3044210 RepID=A0ABT6ZLB8_9ACTN|nr:MULTISPECIES: hypothetical protein [unclassified Olsenella]MDJ1121831.1 hypothetical protein [Olsenella sp. YH-ols2216]MDJ1129839.1 hypothetical protein [Olsenella sp. YH-ols2217]